MVTIIRTIDSGGGGDFTTISAWEAATDTDLVASGDIEIGRIVAGDTQSHAGTVSISGATTDASNFRQLDAEGPAWDPITGTGTTVRDSSTNGDARIRCISGDETARKIRGLRFFRDTTNPTVTGNRQHLQGAGEDQTCRNCVFERTTASSANTAVSYGVSWTGLSTADTDTYIANCIAFGNGLNTGYFRGFLINNGGHAYNLVAYDHEDEGIFFSSGSRDIRNCISIDNGGEDFDFGSGSMNFCMSSDSTATGASSHTSETAADNFIDAANQDFRHIPGSNAVDGGETQTEFTLDIRGGFRPQKAAWDMGPYELVDAAAYLRRYEGQPAPNPLLRM